MPLSPTSARASRCCPVRALPHQPGPPAPPNEITFGQDGDGYIILKARCASSAWPLLATGDARPLRLHRWLVKACEGEVVPRACDDAACIRVAHLTRGTACENLQDAHARKRRQRSNPAPQPQASPADQLAPQPECSFESAAAAARERTFVTGFASPSKRARALARATARAAASTPVSMAASIV